MKTILCKLGIHIANKKMHFENRGLRNKQVTSRSAYCKYCQKKLYRIDKFGNRL